MWWLWRRADEPFGVRPVCVGEHGGALVTDGLGGAVVDVGGSVQAQPVAMFVVIPGEEGLAVPAGGLDGVEATGEVGPVLQGLELGFADGLSSDTCGRLCDWVTPRSASSNATGLAVIEEPRSAWMVNWSRPIACLAQVWRISTSARAADSRVATIQPTTYREKMSKITYR